MKIIKSFLNDLLIQRAIQENLPSTAISVFLGGERKALEDRERRIERSLPSNITKQVSVPKRSQNGYSNRFLHGFYKYENIYSKTCTVAKHNGASDFDFLCTHVLHIISDIK